MSRLIPNDMLQLSKDHPWLLKSLDPSVPLSSENISIPDGQSSLITVIEYKQTEVYHCPETYTTDTWNLEACFVAHPFIFASLHLSDADGLNDNTTQMLNNNIVPSGGDDVDGTDALCTLCERTRISWLSVTAELSAPKTACQGTCYVIQYPRPPSIYNVQKPMDTTDGLISHHLAVFSNEDTTLLDQSQQSKKSYNGLAVDGFYSVMKLTEEARKWHNTSDTYMIGYASVDFPYYGLYFPGDVTYQYGDPMYVSDPFITDPTEGGVSCGSAYPLPYTSDVLKTWFQGIDKTASVKITVRCGLEMMSRPGQTYYPLSRLGELYDQEVLRMHDQAWRLFFDAYPASYNVNETFLKIVKGALAYLQKAMPVIAKLPVVGNLIQPVEDLIHYGVSKIQSSVDKALEKKKKKKGKVAFIGPQLPVSKRIGRLRQRRLAIMKR